MAFLGLSRVSLYQNVALFNIPIGDLIFSPTYVLTYGEKDIAIVFAIFNALLFALSICVTWGLRFHRKNANSSFHNANLKSNRGHIYIYFLACVFLFYSTNNILII